MRTIERDGARVATLVAVVGLVALGAGVTRLTAQAGGAAQAKPAAAKPAGAAL